MKIFDNIDENTVKSIMSKAVTVNYNIGDNIYQSGSIGYIVSGTASVIRTGIGGNSITVRNISSGDIFGAASLFGNWDYNLSKITAQSLCTVKYFSEETFTELLKLYPALAISYIVFLTDRVRFLNRRLDTFSAGSTQNRLYEYFLAQAENGEVVTGVSMTELARRLKIGRTSLYRDIAGLENAGLIKRTGKKFIII